MSQWCSSRSSRAGFDEPLEPGTDLAHDRFPIPVLNPKQVRLPASSHMRRIPADGSHENEPLRFIDLVEGAMVADSLLPDRRNMLERRYELAEQRDGRWRYLSHSTVTGRCTISDAGVAAA